MPISPATGEDLARNVRAIYDDAELALLDLLRRALAGGIESPDWARLKLASVGNLRSAVEEITRTLQHDADGAIGRAIVEAYDRGGQAAVAELGALPEGLRRAAERALPNARSVDRLAAETIASTRPLYQRVLRAVPDAYRSIVQRVSGSVLLGSMTRRQVAQRALDQFASQGITGFVDKAGRSWELGAYAEMAVRTVTGRAAIDGHTDRLAAIGEQLVMVSDAPLECPLCAPWEGEVLAINGESGPHTLVLEHSTQDRTPVVVHVAGSLDEARAAGLFHCNCRHSLSLYLPGLTTRPEPPPQPSGATYADTQQQRYLERQVRAWRRREVAALDDDARQKASARVRDYQGRIRELTAAKDLPRKRVREQIGAAR